MKGLKLNILFLLLCTVIMGGCSGYNKIVKASDYQAKYNLAKTLFVEGKYTNCSSILEECVIMLRGTSQAEEVVYMLASCYYNLTDYISAAQYFRNCYTTYPNGVYAEQSRFYSGKSLYFDTPDPRLDPTSTYAAIEELQYFVEGYPGSVYRAEAEEMIYAMYDRLVEKEYKTATLYYNMGNYLGNNYQACVIVAQNALLDFPSSKYREDLSFLIYKAKFQMAEESVLEKKEERYRDAIDEYYAFKNEFPETKYAKEVEKMFQTATKNVND
ncbi:MAG: outer membrane protein assembly factor BamD [Bacteroidaceae bacterium]|nr:outer membrane protein assembly factor BamD [Bacteroidaceae bacterium]